MDAKTKRPFLCVCSTDCVMTDCHTISGKSLILIHVLSDKNTDVFSLTANWCKTLQLMNGTEKDTYEQICTNCKDLEV